MALKIWSITPRGRVMARSTNNPRNDSWCIIHYLDGVSAKTTEQVASYCGISVPTAGVTLGQLHRLRLVQEETGTEMM